MGLFQITAVPQNWVTQFAICGHNTQTFTSEQNLKSLGLFPDFRVYEVFSNVMSMQLSTSSSQCLWTIRPSRQQWCPTYLAGMWSRPQIVRGEKNMREREKSHAKVHRLTPQSLLSASSPNCRDDTQIYCTTHDPAMGPYRSMDGHLALAW